MSRCRERGWVQEYLDGELSRERGRAFEAHLEGCSGCAAEVAAYRSLFRSLGETRQAVRLDPGPELTERILDRVVPSRLRRRWVTAAGWVYGTVSALSTFLFVTWIVRPETHVWLAERYSLASLRLVQATLFSFQTVTRSCLEVIQGWGWLQGALTHLVGFARVLARPLADPTVIAIGLAALVVSSGLLWWMRAERRPVKEGARHVSLLGF